MRPSENSPAQRSAIVRRIYLVNAIFIGALALLAWRVWHEDQPAEMRGRWVWQDSPKTQGWVATDTLWLGPGDLAAIRGNAVHFGKPLIINHKSLDDPLDLSGSYKWGIATPLTGPPQLCIRYVGDAPPIGCFEVHAGRDTMRVGHRLFRRISTVE